MPRTDYQTTIPNNKIQAIKITYQRLQSALDNPLTDKQFIHGKLEGIEYTCAVLGVGLYHKEKSVGLLRCRMCNQLAPKEDIMDLGMCLICDKHRSDTNVEPEVE